MTEEKETPKIGKDAVWDLATYINELNDNDDIDCIKQYDLHELDQLIKKSKADLNGFDIGNHVDRNRLKSMLEEAFEVLKSPIRIWTNRRKEKVDPEDEGEWRYTWKFENEETQVGIKSLKKFNKKVSRTLETGVKRALSLKIASGLIKGEASLLNRWANAAAKGATDSLVASIVQMRMPRDLKNDLLLDLGVDMDKEE